MRQGSTWLPGASVWKPPCGWASATRRGAGSVRPLSPPASPPIGSGVPGCSWSGVRSGSRGWRSFPTWPEGLFRWLAGRAIDPDAAPRFQSLPGPKPVLGLGRLGPAPSWAVLGEGLFDWLALARWGIPACARPGDPGRGEGRSLPAGLPPRLPRLRLRRRRAGRLRSGLAACLDAGPQPYIFPKAWATLPSLLRCHTDAPPSCVCSQGRRTPPGSSPRGFPARFLAPPHRFLYRALGPLFTHPQRATREDLSPIHDGACPAHGFPQGNPHRLQAREVSTFKKETRHDERKERKRKQQRRPQGRLHHRRPRPALGRALARRDAEALGAP